MERIQFSLAKAYRQLRTDPVAAKLIEKHGPYKPRPGGDPYGRLVRNILFQQLAGAAATTIMNRFFALHGKSDRPPTPKQILSTQDAAFRGAGVSYQKMGYLRDLARHVHDKKLDLKNIDKLTDEEVIESLTAVKGIGEWTAHMYLMFHLGRPDILPVGDLGVQKGMQRAYNLRKLPTPKHMQRIARPWTPYRSVGSWYMWQVADTKLSD